MRRITILIVVLIILSTGITACGIKEVPLVNPTNSSLPIITNSPSPTNIENGVEQASPIPEPSVASISKPTESPQSAATPTVTLFPEKVLHTVTDEYGAIEAEIPVAWTDLRIEPWLDKKNKPIGITFLASTRIEDFLNLKAEGVSISVTNKPETGYVQLLEDEANYYKKICDDTYKTTWNVEHEIYRGKYVVLGCSYNPDSWLSVFSVVNKKDPGAYLARVIGLDLVPTFGDQFRDILMQFKVHPENLPQPGK